MKSQRTFPPLRREKVRSLLLISSESRLYLAGKIPHEVAAHQAFLLSCGQFRQHICGRIGEAVPAILCHVDAPVALLGDEEQDQ